MLIFYICSCAYLFLYMGDFSVNDKKNITYVEYSKLITDYNSKNEIPISFRESMTFLRNQGYKIGSNKANKFFRDYYGLDINLKKQKASRKRKLFHRKNVIAEPEKLNIELKYPKNKKENRAMPNLLINFNSKDAKKFYQKRKKEINRIFKKTALMKEQNFRGYITFAYEYSDLIHYGVYGFNSQLEYKRKSMEITNNRGGFDYVFTIFLRDTDKFIYEKHLKRYMR